MASPESPGLQKLRSHRSGMFIGIPSRARRPSPARSRELRQEAQVAVEEKAQIVDAVAQHREPLEPGAEREADVALGVEPEVAHHGGMHLPRAGNLEPAALQRAALELEVDLRRGLREGEERR